MLLKIALVDDNPLDLLIVSKVIETMGLPADIQKFTDPQLLLKSIKTAEYNPDLILLDIRMPGFSGFDFLDEMQSLKPTGSQARVVMHSSSTDPADQKKAWSYSQVIGYLTKPINKSAFHQLLVDQALLP